MTMIVSYEVIAHPSLLLYQKQEAPPAALVCPQSHYSMFTLFKQALHFNPA